MPAFTSPSWQAFAPSAAMLAALTCPEPVGKMRGHEMDMRKCLTPFATMRAMSSGYLHIEA